MGDDAARVIQPVKGSKEQFIVIEERLKGMDAHGDRHGGALDQSVLVSQGPRHRGRDRQDEQREARGIVRVEARPLRGVRLAALQYPDLAVQQLQTP